MIAVRNLIAALLLLSLPTLAVAENKPPYWASISAGQARMRTGPGRQFPVVWMYQRAGLPVKVVATYPSWRKVEDPDGTQGWMQANLISDKRTAIVTGEIRPMRDEPSPAGKIVWRAEPGVVGKITDCAQGWCKFDVGGKLGYIETAHLWGAN
jgi:SH3-like domain-containing protein